MFLLESARSKHGPHNNKYNSLINGRRDTFSDTMVLRHPPPNQARRAYPMIYRTALSFPSQPLIHNLKSLSSGKPSPRSILPCGATIHGMGRADFLEGKPIEHAARGANQSLVTVAGYANDFKRLRE